MNYGDRLEELGEGLEELGSGRIKKNYPILSGFLDDVKLALSCHIQVGSGLACKYKQWRKPAAGETMLQYVLLQKNGSLWPYPPLYSSNIE